MRVSILPVAVFLSGASYILASDDPITRLTEELAKSRRWEAGKFFLIALPESAKPEEILKDFFKRIPAPGGHIQDFNIEEVRQLTMSESSRYIYAAALISSDHGGQIVIFRYLKEGGGWWTRMYGARYTDKTN